jgi:hypothetical protein
MEVPVVAPALSISLKLSGGAFSATIDLTPLADPISDSSRRGSPPSPWSNLASVESPVLLLDLL